MKVSHFCGITDCNTVEELESVLSIRCGDGVNEFWISGDKDIPCLAVLVNNDYANLTYFPEDGHPGYQSIGMDTDLRPEGTTIFYTNTQDEEIEVYNDTVVPFAKALEAVKEYFITSTIPSCIKWRELSSRG